MLSASETSQPTGLAPTALVADTLQIAGGVLASAGAMVLDLLANLGRAQANPAGVPMAPVLELSHGETGDLRAAIVSSGPVLLEGNAGLDLSPLNQLDINFIDLYQNTMTENQS